jgi:hypothetical protein
MLQGAAHGIIKNDDFPQEDSKAYTGQKCDYGF